MKFFFEGDHKLNRALNYFARIAMENLCSCGLSRDREDICSRLALAALEAKERYRPIGSEQKATASLFTYCARAMKNEACLIVREAIYESRVFDPNVSCDQLDICDPSTDGSQFVGLYVRDIMNECDDRESLVAGELLDPSPKVSSCMKQAVFASNGRRGRPPGYRDMMGSAIGAAHGMNPDTVVYLIKNVRKTAKKVLAIENVFVFV